MTTSLNTRHSLLDHKQKYRHAASSTEQSISKEEVVMNMVNPPIFEMDLTPQSSTTKHRIQLESFDEEEQVNSEEGVIDITTSHTFTFSINTDAHEVPSKTESIHLHPHFNHQDSTLNIGADASGDLEYDEYDEYDETSSLMENKPHQQNLPASWCPLRDEVETNKTYGKQLHQHHLLLQTHHQQSQCSQYPLYSQYPQYPQYPLYSRPLNGNTNNNKKNDSNMYIKLALLELEILHLTINQAFHILDKRIEDLHLNNIRQFEKLHQLEIANTLNVEKIKNLKLDFEHKSLFSKEFANMIMEQNTTPIQKQTEKTNTSDITLQNITSTNLNHYIAFFLLLFCCILSYYKI